MKVQKMPVRLNKYLADSGTASRRKAEEFILQGRVTVNDKVVIELAYKVDEENDEVMLDGERVSPVKHIYIIMNKPRGVVTTTSDEKNRTTVVDIIDVKEKIFPVGRLDYNTTGVLLLTNDGDFSNYLTHPRNKITREYEVTLDRPLQEEDKAKLLKGVFIDNVRGVFKKVSFIKNNRTNVLVEAMEGRNHFVKNMFGELSYTVKSLNRKSFAGFTVNIPVGAWRFLKPEEVNKIKSNYE